VCVADYKAMKKYAKQLDGTPNKKLYWSIISDYNLRTSLCELIDNALDIWLKTGKAAHLQIDITLDYDQQTIQIVDSAGGVPESHLEFLITPGGGNNSRDENIIGIFGVGSKRAVVALAQDIRIRTRHKNEKSFEIVIDNIWLEDDSWELTAFEIPDLSPNTTQIELSRLRVKLTPGEEDLLRGQIEETYGYFLAGKKFAISINDRPLIPALFDQWAYPPDFGPRCFLFELETPEKEKVGVDITAGLISTKDPGREDYGVYFYCNDRLIEKEVKKKDVGYISGIAGLPHSDASLARIIVKLHGATKHMPWNSSKSAINFGHHTFQALQGFLLPVVTDYTSLSRRFKGQWEEKVFAHTDGKIEHVDIKDVGKIKRSYLPPLPKVYKHKVDMLKTSNRSKIKDEPWTLGLVEAVAAVDLLRRQRSFETRNRMALLLLDSSFEIALKEFIVHTQGLNLAGKSLEQIFEHRDAVIKVVRQKVDFDSVTLTKINHYYMQRNKLVHERATVEVTDADVDNYSETIQKVLTKLFGLSF